MSVGMSGVMKAAAEEFHQSLNVNYDEISRLQRIGEDAEKARKRKTRRKPEKVAVRVERRYFTKATGVTEENQRDLLKEASPFVYPDDMELLAHKVMTKAWRSELRLSELPLKYNERHNAKTRQQASLLNRLYVKDPPDVKMVTITDVDPEFFTIVEGRPIKEKLDIREYVNTVRDVLRTKIVTGYREDDIMLIDENIILEQKMLDEIRSNYQMYVNVFEEFLYKDHTKSMNLLRESEQVAGDAHERYEEYKQLSKELGALRSIVYSTEEKWRNAKLYQRFLYLVSPMSWRKEHDFYYNEAEELGLVDEVSTIFGKYRIDYAEDSLSLEDLIHQFKAECSTQDEPKLYFDDPEQLLEVFRFMELQNLNSLLHSEELAVPLEAVKEGMAQAEQLFEKEMNALQEVIDKLAGGILWEEERAKNLEELAMELINGVFKPLVIDDDVLKLHVFVEDVYETRIGPNDANLKIGDMMKSIEDRFREELITLDQMPSELVQMLETSCYVEEARVMKKAEEASRRLMEFERLFDNLIRVFSPPHKKFAVKELKFRSPPVNPPKPIPPPPRELTLAEQQYLDFFTMYCKHSDDPKEYGIDITQSEEDLGRRIWNRGKLKETEGLGTGEDDSERSDEK